MLAKKNLSLKAEIVRQFDHLYKFAQHIDVHPSIVTQVIAGHWRLKSDEKQRWAEALGRSVDDLFTKKAR